MTPFRSKAPQRVYSKEHIDGLLYNMKKEVIREIVEDYSYAFVLVMHDYLGFGHKRIRNVMEKMHTLWDDVRNGYLSVEDIKNTVIEEIKFKID
jgi:hypothetical protein